MRALVALLLTGLATAKPPPPRDNGRIHGTIRWIGPRPNLEADARGLDGSCANAASNKPLVVGRGGGVADVVVWLEGIQDVPPDKPRTARLEHDRCGLSPRVAVVPVGSRIEIRTASDAGHGVAAEGDAGPPFSLRLPKRKGQKVRSKPLGAAGVVELGCEDEHSPPHVFIHVAEHPFFALTDQSGTYDFTGVPPGAYYLRLWHPGWTEKGPVLLHQEIDVAWNTDESIDFRLRDF